MKNLNYQTFDNDGEDELLSYQIEQNTFRSIMPIFTLGAKVGPIYTKGPEDIQVTITFSNGVKLIKRQNFWIIEQLSNMISIEDLISDYFLNFEDVFVQLPENMQMTIIFNLDTFRRL